MRISFVLSLLIITLFLHVDCRKHRWSKHHKGFHKGATQNAKHAVHQKRLRFTSDSLPYSSPYSRPYDWNMYSDGPYGWGPARKRREINSFYKFKRSLYPQNYAPQPQQQMPAQQAAYYQAPSQPNQAAAQPYQAAAQSYQTAQSRNTLAQVNPNYAQPLRKKVPEVQQPRERTWVDKMGVTWTTRKVNDYKWGEREPGVTMDEYAGGPFGFNDVKRSQIQNAQWQRRSSIPNVPSTIQSKRSWIDSNGVRWTTNRVNDYKWGEREPGVTMDEYNGGPYGWVKRNKILRPSSITTPRNMYMDKP